MPQRVISKIVEQKKLTDGHYQMIIKAPEITQQCQPGQFLHLKWVSTNHDPLLRRPISINDFDAENGEISLIYRVVGRGTERLAELKSGEQIDLMGPLGEGFTFPKASKKAVVIGGGMGLAPLYPVVKSLKELGTEVTLLLGAERKAELLNYAEYKEMELDLKVATVDGSCGYQGLVTDLLKEVNAKEVDYLYTCGPEAMMEVIKEWTVKNDIIAEASLEERMGCGTGACLSCVCKIKTATESGFKYRKACTEGPVFPLAEVIFDE